MAKRLRTYLDLLEARKPTAQQPLEHVAKLPPEILLHIFSYLNITQLGTVARTSKQWDGLVQQPHLYKIAVFYGTRIADNVAKRVANRLGHCHTLVLDRAKNDPWPDLLTDAGFKILLSGCNRRMRKISLAHRKRLSPMSLKLIAYQFSSIESLNVAGCFTIYRTDILISVGAVLRANAVSLKSFNCSGCPSDTLIYLFACWNLETLVASVLWDGVSTTAIANACTNLKHLQILDTHSFGNDKLIPILTKCPSLTSIRLSGTSVDLDCVCSYTLTALKTLMLTSMRLGPSNLHKLGENLPNLQSLCLMDCVAISDTNFHHVALLKNLTRLELFKAYGMSDETVKHIAKLTQMRSLLIGNNKLISNHGVQHLTSLTHLKYLTLFRFSKFSGATLALPGVTSLDLSMCYRVRDDQLKHVLSVHTNLKSLCLAKVRNISVQGLGPIGRLKVLQSLDLSYCDKLRDSALSLVGECKSLRTLIVRGLNITFEGIYAVLAACKRLSAINVSDCKNHLDENQLDELTCCMRSSGQTVRADVIA